jgi:hypothetical protein
METISTNIMLRRIAKFITKYNDYKPVADSKKHQTIGYYNAFYHMEDNAFSMVYKPSKTRRLPVVIGGYEVLDNGNVYVITTGMNRYNLERCGDASIRCVYNTLIKEKEA